MGIVFGDGAVAVVKKKVQSYSGVVGKTLHIMLPSGWDSLILRNYREFQLQSEYNFSRKRLWPQ